MIRNTIANNHDLLIENNLLTKIAHNCLAKLTINSLVKLKTSKKGCVNNQSCKQPKLQITKIANN